MFSWIGDFVNKLFEKPFGDAYTQLSIFFLLPCAFCAIISVLCQTDSNFLGAHASVKT